MVIIAINSLVIEAGLSNQKLLENEVEVARGGETAALASAHVAAEALAAPAETADGATQLHADSWLHSASVVEP